MSQLLLVLVGAIGIGLGIGAALFVPKSGGDSAQEASVAGAFEMFEEGEGEEFDVEQGGSTQEVFEVLKVIDGDTVTIQMGDKKETVRMIGIDTPETNDTRTGVQCFGAEATAQLKKIIGKRVAVEKDAGEGERDKYDRLLAYLFSENGVNLNRKMIEDGYAYEYTYDDAYKYQKEFKAVEEVAKEEGRGLWAPDACPEPVTKVPAKKEVTPTAFVAPPTVLGVATTIPTSTVSAQEPESPKLEPEAKKEEPKPEPETEPKEDVPPAQSASEYTCASNKYNCTHFKTRAEAQAVYDQCGGASNDVHKLDSNKDGEACESLP